MNNPEDAADLAQEICLHCLLGQAQFRGEAEFTTWLHRIAVNACVDFLRKRSRRKEVAATEAGEWLYQMALAQRAANQDRDVLAETVQRALSQLTSHQRQVLTWKYVEGRTHAEIAQRLEIKEASVWQAVHRSREAFKKAYEGLRRATG